MKSKGKSPFHPFALRIIAGLKLPPSTKAWRMVVVRVDNLERAVPTPFIQGSCHPFHPLKRSGGGIRAGMSTREQKSLAIRANHNHRLFPSLQLNSLHQFIQTYSICVPSVT
ncbi:hypothetical protein CEXT_592091 [Caerostris extrusa]|uniref:Uncharacterized protein n=1 Tax=Caerostris extrusa TaxID=172846 RepID=A0AAV4VYH0_CAEEX|nr:hypothetical protein CEXT_592091 [Caerostris extrusa]